MGFMSHNASANPQTHKATANNLHATAPRAGDWECPSCGRNVFASKTECFKCGEPRPEGAGGGGGGGDAGGYGQRHRALFVFHAAVACVLEQSCGAAAALLTPKHTAAVACLFQQSCGAATA